MEKHITIHELAIMLDDLSVDTLRTMLQGFRFDKFITKAKVKNRMRQVFIINDEFLENLEIVLTQKNRHKSLKNLRYFNLQFQLEKDLYNFKAIKEKRNEVVKSLKELIKLLEKM